MGSWITGYGSYLVGTALSSNGSKVAVMRCTPFRLTSFSCLPMADTMPPDRRNAPPTLIDIVTLEEVLFVSFLQKWLLFADCVCGKFHNNSRCARVDVLEIGLVFENEVRTWFRQCSGNLSHETNGA